MQGDNMVTTTNFSNELCLPELTGSEKQVEWATTIRAKIIDKVEKRLSEVKLCNVPNSDVKQSGIVLMVTFLNRVFIPESRISDVKQKLYSITDSNYWINERDTQIDWIIANILKCINEEHANIDYSDSVGYENTAIAPENCSKPGEVKIAYNTETNKISCAYAKDDDFRQIVKSCGYKWNSRNITWDKQIDFTTGDADDRIVEIANKLLNNGFVVNIPQELADRAIKAEYEPECKRWITVLNKTKICIGINYGDDDIYRAARKISGAAWERGAGVIVPASSYDEIRDFADIYGYKLSPITESMLTDAETERNKILDGAVSVAKKEPQKRADKLKSKLELTGVIDDLRDDD